MRLARGEPAVAVALLERHLGTGAGAADVASVLVLLVEARLANAEPDRAAQAAEQLAAFAATRPTDYVAAQSAMAAGHLAAARGDVDEATAHFHTAGAIVTRLGLPLDAGQANLASARAHAPGSPQLAIAEAGAALAVFDQVGATVLADAAAALLRSLGVARRSVPRMTRASNHDRSGRPGRRRCPLAPLVPTSHPAHRGRASRTGCEVGDRAAPLLDLDERAAPRAPLR